MHNIVVKIQLDMYTEQNGMPVKLDLVERVVVDRLEIKKRKTIMILASDRSENTVGGISVVSIGGSEHTVAWKNDIYCGSITCSEDRISLVRKIAIERTRYSVHLHVFRF